MFISFLSLGQGGGNIADLAAKKGFYSAAINFSERDLESLEYVERKLKLVGSEGIGKIRNDAIQLMNNNWDLATNFVKENFSHSSIEIIFVPFSTGGGSGSGIAPVLLSLLKETMPDKVFVAMPIIPDQKESYINQKNCLETFEDLSELDICILPIDNNKSNMRTMGKNNLYKSVNEAVVNLINHIVSFTQTKSNLGVIDKKDIRSIFCTSGIATIAEVELSLLSGKFEMSERGVAERIRDSWIEAIFVDVEFDKVISAGFIFEGQEKMMEFLDLPTVFSSFQNKLPINLYEGYYIGEKDRVLTILSGLSWCNSRLESIDKILEDTSKSLGSVSESMVFKSKNISNSISLKNNRTKEKVKDISSIINKFKRN